MADGGGMGGWGRGGCVASHQALHNTPTGVCIVLRMQRNRSYTYTRKHTSTTNSPTSTHNNITTHTISNNITNLHNTSHRGVLQHAHTTRINHHTELHMHTLKYLNSITQPLNYTPRGDLRNLLPSTRCRGLLVTHFSSELVNILLESPLKCWLCV